MDDRTLANTVKNAEYRAALGSIRYNASNFQVFTVGIASSFLLGVAVLAGTFVTIQAEDLNMPTTTLIALVITDGVFLGLLFLAYISYLRNMGMYIFGRVKPAFDSPENIAKCPKNVSTGTSPNSPRSLFSSR